jgi:bacteriocin-like protein
MKLFNIFKKESSKEATKANIQKLDKNQLSKVIGGGGPDSSRGNRRRCSSKQVKH